MDADAPDAAKAALFDELGEISRRIIELEDELGHDPSHQRNPDGAYQQRTRLYVRLRELGVPYTDISEACGVHSETIRAVVNKAKVRAQATTT